MAMRCGAGSSQDLGFDRASRNKNVERIAEAAALIASQGGIAIAAPIAPFTEWACKGTRDRCCSCAIPSCLHQYTVGGL